MPFPKKKDKDRRKGTVKVVTTVWGTELIQFFAALATCIFHQDDSKKRMDRMTASWRNGCLGKMDDHLVHTIYKTTTVPKWMFSEIFSSNHPCC